MKIAKNTDPIIAKTNGANGILFCGLSLYTSMPLSMHASVIIYKKFVSKVLYLIRHLCEYHQIHNFPSVGHKDGLF